MKLPRKPISPLDYVSSGFSIVKYHQLSGFMADGNRICRADPKRVYLYVAFDGLSDYLIDTQASSTALVGVKVKASPGFVEFFIDKHFSLVQSDWYVVGMFVANPFAIGIVKNS